MGPRARCHTLRRVLVQETFDAETQNSRERQRTGWQAILDNFGRHVEAKA